MSDPTYRDLLYFLKLLYTTVFAVTALWHHSIEVILFSSFLTFGLTWLALHRVYNAATAWDWLHWTRYIALMIGKYVCPSCQKQCECLEYICTSEIYRGITLLSVSTVGSIYNGFYIVFCRVVGMNPREWKSSGEHLRCVSMHLTRPASKVKLYVRLSVFVSDFCTPV